MKVVNSSMNRPQHQQGFSLFELVLSMAVMSFIFIVSMQMSVKFIWLEVERSQKLQASDLVSQVLWQIDYEFEQASLSWVRPSEQSFGVIIYNEDQQNWQQVAWRFDGEALKICRYNLREISSSAEIKPSDLRCFGRYNHVLDNQKFHQSFQLTLGVPHPVYPLYWLEFGVKHKENQVRQQTNEDAIRYKIALRPFATDFVSLSEASDLTFAADVTSATLQGEMDAQH